MVNIGGAVSWPPSKVQTPSKTEAVQQFRQSRETSRSRRAPTTRVPRKKTGYHSHCSSPTIPVAAGEDQTSRPFSPKGRDAGVATRFNASHFDSRKAWSRNYSAAHQAIDAGLVISSCGSNFRLVPSARDTRHNFSARLSSSRARSRSSFDAIFKLGRTTICVNV